MRRDEGSGTASSEAQRRAADAGAKALMPVGGHALVDHILSALADAGIGRVVLVVPPDHDAFRAHVAARRVSRVAIDFAVQAEARGTADAVHAAEPFVLAAPFLVINGDNFYPREAINAVRLAGPHAMGGFDASSLVTGGNIPADRLRRFAFAWTDEAGDLVRLEEKPESASPDDHHARVSMNLWAFGPRIFDACARITPSARGELELTDAVRLLIGPMRERMRVVPVPGPVLDLSFRGDIAEVERLLAGHEVRL
jgi:glucose-1-phosphate thymidylyltransferase